MSQFARLSGAWMPFALLLAALGGILPASSSSAPGLRATAADTATVFGPRRFQAGGGQGALHVERFSAPPSAAPYLLRLEPAPGEPRPSRVTVRLNGAELVSAGAGDGPVVEVPVLLRADNVLEVRVTGSGAVLLRVDAPADGSFAVLQPRRFMRARGAPAVETVRFTLPAGAGTPQRLYVVNGEADGTRRVSSAVVRLNGAGVIAPSDLNQNVGGLVRGVLLAGENVVEVEVRSAPGSFLTLWVTAADTTPPVLVLEAPAAGLVTRETEVDAAGHVLDPTPARVSVNGVPAAVSGGGFRARVPLAAEGENVLVYTATDAAGLRMDSARTVIRDTEAPVLAIDAPAEGAIVRDGVIRVTGSVRDRTQVTANVNGIAVTPDGTGAFGVDVPLEADGTHFVTLAATDQAGNTASLVRSLVRDDQAPVVAFTRPAEGAVTREGRTEVAGTVQDASPVRLMVNGIAMEVVDGAFRGTVPLAGEGRTAIVAAATDAAGNEGRAERAVVRDTTPPALVMDAPAEGRVTRAAEVEVTGRVADSTAVVLTLGGAPVSVGADGRFTATAPLGAEGTNALDLVATDAAGNASRVERGVVRDTEAPVVDILAPAAGTPTRASAVAVPGVVRDRTAVRVTVNGVTAVVDSAGGFSAEVPLDAEGANAIAAVATDAAGNEGAAATEVVRDTQAPVITVTHPVDGLVTRDSAVAITGRVQDAGAVTLRLDGAEVELGDGNAFATRAALALGGTTLVLEARDAAGNTASVAVAVVREAAPTGPQLPPDPSTVAPALNQTVQSTVARAAEFLYTGESPLQVGVAPAALEPLRTALVRGRVLDRALQPLGGVTVSVRGQPQLGRTMTRADGAYDLAVNGGGPLSLDFERDGYLPAQRRVDVPWQAYTAVEDVVLLQPDAQATVVALGSTETQVARGSVQQDADGARQATLLVPPGTEAVLRLPDGSTQPLGAVTVRATEFTVGENGRAAMPGPLPPQTMYTYAVALTADEAVRADGQVELSRPVPFYVENFLGFPVGTQVPVGVWTPETGAWVPEPDGRVIRIVDVVGGAARVDATGDGTPDAPGPLGLEPWELEQLARTYPPGTQLWRAPVRDLRIRDLNMPGEVLGQDPAVPAPSCASGDPATLLECRAQVNVQALPLAGTPFALVYASDRVPGRAQGMEVRLTPDSIHPDLQGVELEITVAGRTWRERFDPAPNLRHTFQWDGTDAYGRTLQGTQPAVVRVGYVFPVVYQVPAPWAATFGLSCAGATLPGYARCVLPSTANSQARQQATRWQTIHTGVGTWDAGAQEMGSWGLSPHHAYDPMTRTLYRGDGTTRAAAGMAPVRERFSRTAFYGYSLGTPAAEPGGGVLVTASPRQYFESSLYRVTPAGDTVRLAGSGSRAFNGYGGPARDANIVALAMARGPDGSVYLNDWVNYRVHRVAPDGTLQPFAGTGVRCESHQFVACGGEGGPATQAGTTAGPLAAGPDGSVYVAGANRVRRVGPDGTIHTVAGVGTSYTGRDCSLHYYGSLNCGDGGPALAAMISPAILHVGPDGRLYIGDGASVRRVDPDGVIRRVVGTGEYHEQGLGDGGPATQARLGNVAGIAAAADGTVYVATEGGSFGRKLVWRVTPDGLIRIVAGHHAATRLETMSGLALGPDGSLFVSEYASGSVVRIGAPLPGALESWRSRTGNTAAGPVTVASDDGRELYRFDGAGRHEATLDAVTGVTVHSFAYDGQGRLATVTDRSGLVTRVERDGDGTAVAVVGPYGERTELAPGQSGALGGITGPGGQAVEMEYGDGGLLRSRTDAGGRTTAFAYDGDGRLTGQTSPDGASYTVGLAQDGAGQRLSGTLASGTGIQVGVQPLPGGGSRRTSVLPSGAEVVSVATTDGKTVTTGVDGTVVTVTETPDPRYGLQAPLRDETVRLPSGLTRTTTHRRTVTLSDPANPASLTRQTDTETVNGRVRTEVYERAAGRVTRTSAAGRQSVTLLDAQGRVRQEQVTGLTAVVNSYDAQGRLERVTQGARSLAYTYDAQGRVATATDAVGRTQRYTYDGAGRVLTQTLADGRVIGYTYDAAGNLASVTPPTRPAHTFGYTAAGLNDRYTAPDAGAGTAVTRMEYDADQRVREVLRPDGVRVEMRYDSAGRRSGLLLPEGEVRFGYDAATGKLASALSPDGVQLDYGYDGGLLTEVRWTGPVAGTLRSRYDSDFRVAAQRLNGDSIGYRYDADGLLAGVGALTLTRSPQNGLLTGTSLGGITSSVGYNAFGERSGFTYSSGGATLFGTSYTRDDAGRITGVTETAGGTTTAYAYRYDGAGRLVEVKRGGAVVESYEYDANGNRLRAVTPLGVADATVDAQDRLLTYGGASFAYAAGGELRSRVVGSDTTRYAYDALGSLREVVLPDGTRIDYVADAEGRRVGKRVNGALVQGFLYQDALEPVAELDASGAVAARFVYGEAAHVPEYMVRGGRTFRIVADHLGSVRMVVDAQTGQVAQRMDYDAWGNVVLDSNPGFQPFGYAGGLYDGHTALTRFGARDYDARTGRWTAKDPILFEGGDANVYGYVLQDPVNMVDPTGNTPYAATMLGMMSTTTFIGVLSVSMAGGCVGNGTDYIFDSARRTFSPRKCLVGAGVTGLLTVTALASVPAAAGFGGAVASSCAVGGASSYMSTGMSAEMGLGAEPTWVDFVSGVLGGCAGPLGGKMVKDGLGGMLTTFFFDVGVSAYGKYLLSASPSDRAEVYDMMFSRCSSPSGAPGVSDAC